MVTVNKYDDVDDDDDDDDDGRVKAFQLKE